MPLVELTVVLLGAAVVVVPLFYRARLGSVLGYLAIGVLLGPFGVALVSDVDAILHFAELGVVLLLFIIGLELQPSRLWVLRRSVFGLGASQVFATGAVLGLAGYALGLSPGAAAVVGLALALSSTAFVLQTLAEKGQLTTAHGRASFSVLLFQDLAVVPLLVLIPLLGPTTGEPTKDNILVAVGVAAGTFVLVVLAGRYLLRPVFRLVAGSDSHEIFIALALFIVLGVAVLMEHIGLSMAMGAFLAGVLLADSEYRHELEVSIEPFKGLLLGLFFIAVGMSANLGLLVDRPVLVLVLALALMAVKAVLLFAVAKLGGRSNAAAAGLALYLGQGGEFAFVILAKGTAFGVLEPDVTELMVVVVTVSMAVSPVLFALNDRIVQPRLGGREVREYDAIEPTGSRVIIAGFGRFGQIVGRLLRVKGIPFTALDDSAEQVDVVRRFGTKIYYGNATRLDMLRAAGAEEAELLVLSLEDVDASLKVVDHVKHHFPHLTIFARARDRKHAHLLMDVGVTHVVRETLHSSLNLASDVLEALGTPPDKVAQTIETFRQHDQRTLVAQHAIHHDEIRLIQTANEAAKELQALLEADQSAASDELLDAEETPADRRP